MIHQTKLPLNLKVIANYSDRNPQLPSPSHLPIHKTQTAVDGVTVHSTLYVCVQFSSFRFHKKKQQAELMQLQLYPIFVW